MKRWLFTILSGLSLLLFVAVVVLWVRSYWHTDVVAYSDDPSRIGLVLCDSGQAMFHCTEGPIVTFYLARFGIAKGGVGYRVSRPDGKLYDYVPLDGSIDYRLAGFGFVGGQGAMDRERAILLPLWFVAVLFGALPVLQLNRLIRKALSEEDGCCPICGYDLRATPDRCPECGHKPVVPVGWSGRPAVVAYPGHASKKLLAERRRRQA